MALRFTLKQLEYFVAVGEAGSIAAASERMNVSSPSISAAISALESALGVQLFVRKHAHGLSLTSGGRRLLAATRQLLDDARGLHALAADVSGVARGPLNIGCLLTFAQLVMPALRSGFERAYPEVHCRQREADPAELLVQLRRAEIDVALTYDLEIAPDLEFEPLVALPPYVLLPEGHALAARGSVSLHDLADEPMVLLDLPMSAAYFLSIAHSSGIRPKIAERTSNIAVAHSLVANGFGYALLNARPRTELAPDGKPLRFVQLEGDYRPMIMGIATMRSEHRAAALQAFVEFCRSNISAAGVPGLADGHGHPVAAMADGESNA